MEQICSNNGFELKNGKIMIPSWVKHVKIDIGLSYSAPQSNVWLNSESDLLVFGFEPNSESCKMILSHNNKKLHTCHGDVLENRFIKSGQFKLLPVALSDSPSEMDLFITEQDVGCSSLFEPKQNFLKIQKKIKVPVFTLANFFELLPNNLIIEYIKIDAQGSDLNIIKGGGKYISDRVIWVTLEPECSTYENISENNVTNIVTYMKSIGFEFYKHPNTDDQHFIILNLVTIKIYLFFKKDKNLINPFH
jgi:FkbM family methyltransferase